MTDMKLPTDQAFAFYSLPGRVVFGEGCLSTLGDEVQALARIIVAYQMLAIDISI